MKTEPITQTPSSGSTWRRSLPGLLLWATVIILTSIYASITFSPKYHPSISLSALRSGASEINLGTGIKPITVVSENGKEIYRLTGWVFPKDDSILIEPLRTRMILLNPDEEITLVEMQNVTVDGLNMALPDVHRDLSQSGYQLDLGKYDLPVGLYQVGFLFTGDGDSQYFGFSQRYLSRTPNSLRLINKREAANLSTRGIRYRLSLAVKNLLDE